MSDLTLTKEEMAALDLLIATLQANPQLQPMFIGDIVNVVKKVADVVNKVCPVVTLVVNAAGGVSGYGSPQVGSSVPSGSSLDLLIELRKRLNA